MDLDGLYDPCFLLHLFSELTRPGNAAFCGLGLRAGATVRFLVGITTMISDGLLLILEGSSSAFPPFHFSDFQRSNSECFEYTVI